MKPTSKSWRVQNLRRKWIGKSCSFSVLIGKVDKAARLDRYLILIAQASCAQSLSSHLVQVGRAKSLTVHLVRHTSGAQRYGHRAWKA